MGAFFVLALGLALRWASFLKNVTEGAGVWGAYGVDKFVERAVLASLGLDHLLGTPALKTYMHGFFAKLALYDAARVRANPFAYDEHRARQAQAKLDTAAASRIRAPKPGFAVAAAAAKVGVKKALAARVHREQERARAGPLMNVDGADVDADKPSVLTDPRFAALFADPEFVIDERTREFALLNPSAAHASGAGRGLGVFEAAQRARTAVESEEEGSECASSEPDDASDAGSGDSSDEGDLGVQPPSHRFAPSAHERPAPAPPRMRRTSMRTGGRGGRGTASASHARRLSDGGVQVSWVPSRESAARHAAEDAAADTRAACAGKRRGKGEVQGAAKAWGAEASGTGLECGGRERG